MPIPSHASIDAGRVLIVGAGLAGLFTALKLSGPVTIITGAPLGAGASSAWAQGGVAAALGADDSADLHVADTLAAGAGTVDAAVATLMARDAEARINDLAALGVPFDRDANGAFVLGREAAHQRKRIVRVRGDRAGAAIMAALVKAVRNTPRIQVIEGLRAFDLITDQGRACGVWAVKADAPREPVAVLARMVVFALGGAGGLYSVTTNPPQAAGHALAMGARAGAVIADPEFVQFHPTALDVGLDPAPLATEALRGEGAALINQRGERFMLSVHPDAELAPRDVVARGIFREIKAGRRVYLDARQAVGARFADAFPTVFAACQAAGINPALAPIPVAPAAHYHMGGLATDDLGRTTVNGLWAVGECASTGVHGANRLASNSLLEAVVFGARAAADMDAQSPPERSIFLLNPPALGGRGRDMKTMRQVMTRFVGLERDGVGLAQALAQISALLAELQTEPMAQNQAMAALLIAAGAYQRTESRGGHFRTDCRRPAPDWAHRTFLTLKDALSIAERARAEQGSGANALYAAAGK